MAKPSTKAKPTPPAAAKSAGKPPAATKKAPAKATLAQAKKAASKQVVTKKAASAPIAKGKQAAKKAAPEKKIAAAAPPALKTKPASKPAKPSPSPKGKAATPAAPLKKAAAPASKAAAKKAPPASKKASPPAQKAAPSPKKQPSVKTTAKPKAATASKSKKAAPAPAPIVVVAEPPPAPEPPPAQVPRNELPDFPPGPTANGAIYYDTHMHTPLCKHAWGEPEEYASQALLSGLKGIIFTCHCPMPDGFWPSVRMSEAEFETYVALVDRAAHAFEGRLDVRLGMESEFFPGVEPWIEKLHQRTNFHYLLGAVHWQARDYLAKFETGTIEAFRKTYFNHLAASAESGLYDCLAHPDLVKNYHPDSWCLAIVKDSIANALDRIAKTGVAMELNTSGLNKSYSEMNPGLEMLRMMADREIPIVVASDAHRPHRVGEQFMTALSHLQEAGYDQVSYFLHRKRIDLKIATVQASIKKAADSQLA